MGFNNKLKKVRILLNISQETMARELNVSFATINRLEKGKTLPSYKTLKNFEILCQNYNIVMEDKNV